MDQESIEAVCTSSPDEAVIVWLQSELKSKRFQDDLYKSLDKYGLDEHIITKPNLSDIY